MCSVEAMNTPKQNLLTKFRIPFPIHCFSFNKLKSPLRFVKTNEDLIRKSTWILVLNLSNKYVLITYYVPGVDLGDQDTSDKDRCPCGADICSCGRDGHKQLHKNK